MLVLLLQVLQTGDEIAELDQSGFYTQETTVWAGNIGQKKYNVQVWSGVLVWCDVMWCGVLVWCDVVWCASVM